jgi:hypothetical protein
LHTLLAAEAAVLKLVPPEKASVTAGQRVSFAIELFAQGQFSGPTYFDLPEIKDAIILQDSARPVLGTRQISGETYVFARHDFTVYPQQGGALSVPPITARFGSKAAYNQPTVEHRLQTASFAIEVQTPPGALPGEVIVSTSTFQATETWSPQPAAAKVGDAFTRAITIRAQGVPAMLLPALKFDAPIGLAIYPTAPQIKDETERGEYTGTRIDTLTYVCERAGSFEIPELRLRWWDPKVGEWQTQRFPPVTLQVAENPSLATQSLSTIGAVTMGPDIKSLSGLILLMVAIVLLVAFAFTRLLPRWHAWRARLADSEPVQWKRLQKACDRGKVSEVYLELDHWLAHFGMSTLDLMEDLDVDATDQLYAAYLGFQRKLAGIDAKWEAGLLLEELTNLRRILCKSVSVGNKSLLPPLNPERTVESRIAQIT